MLDTQMLRALYNAAFERRSCRRFSGRAIPDEKADALLSVAANGLSVGGGARIVVLSGGTVSDRVFSMFGPLKVLRGTTMTAVIIRDKRSPHGIYEAGFLGEQVVLEAARLRVASCWVAGTYSRRGTRSLVKTESHEDIAAVIGLGLAPDDYDWSARSVLAARKKPFTSITNLTTKDAPEWARHAVLCAQYAPSAMNRQPWWFEFDHDRALGSLTLHTSNPSRGRVAEPLDMTKLDHGIAMLHTLVGATFAGYEGQWKLTLSPDGFAPPYFIVR